LEAIECLLGHATRIFGNDVDVIDCATSVPEIEMILKKRGFIQTRNERPTIVCRNVHLRHRMQELDGRWFFTKGDQDWDQVLVA
jgi:hypothetical protein